MGKNPSNNNSTLAVKIGFAERQKHIVQYSKQNHTIQSKTLSLIHRYKC